MGLLELFCQVDEFCQAFLPADHRALVAAGYRAGNIDPGADVTGVKLIERLSDMPPERAFDVGLRQPLRLLAEQGNLQPLTLLVDALDEAWQAYQNHPSIVELLAGAADLPPQVRFILLARNKSESCETLRPVSPKVLKADSCSVENLA
ncbi:MAG: hypothetical protein KatS3mg052_2508 [Candidatus Roseilinea sp.]|nr:MAG: hypothetical protein KatS3mg052_2508 [Candidatus Roseilinea sp.]